MHAALHSLSPKERKQLYTKAHLLRDLPSLQQTPLLVFLIRLPVAVEGSRFTPSLTASVRHHLALCDIGLAFQVVSQESQSNPLDRITEELHTTELPS
jgi:hypothetical protein